jgi:hypothetical protein
MITALILASALAAAPADPNAPLPPAAAPAGADTAVAKPPAPGIKPGMPVVGPSGERIGDVQSLAETPGGLNVVVKIDGKLVGAPASALQLNGSTVVSAQSKAQLLAAGGAPQTP